MGDPAGIGPEVILKALSDASIRKSIAPLLIGEAFVFEKIKKIINSPFSFNVIKNCRKDRFDKSNHYNKVKIEGAVSKSEKINLLNLEEIKKSDFVVGKVSKATGKAAIAYVRKGFFLARDKRIDALVTAPINKEAVKLSNFPYPGHTEFLAALSKRKKVGMVLAAKELKVLLVTTHLALRDIFIRLSEKRILEKIKLGYHFLKDDLKLKNPRIGLCGLNPHNGEKGIFGDEEERVIKPAIAAARRAGINCIGPVPSDVIFYQATKQKKYDLVIAMYHDQGLIPIKTLYFKEAVNITIGLPLIRTSPDHGTAFDIAYQGKADSTSMKEAIRYAARLVSVQGNKRSPQTISV